MKMGGSLWKTLSFTARRGKNRNDHPDNEEHDWRTEQQQEGGRHAFVRGCTNHNRNLDSCLRNDKQDHPDAKTNYSLIRTNLNPAIVRPFALNDFSTHRRGLVIRDLSFSSARPRQEQSLELEFSSIRFIANP